MLNVVCQVSGDDEILISLVEFRFSNGQGSFAAAIGLIFFPEQIECYTYFFQFIVYMLVIRERINVLYGMSVWVEHAVDFHFGKRTYVTVCDAALFRNAEDVADRIPGNVPAVSNGVPGKFCFP